MELKDKILNAAYGKVSVTPGCVDGDSEATQAAITALHNEGLVKIGGRGSHGGKSAVLNFEIMTKGAELVDSGGYSKIEKTERRYYSRKLIFKVLSWIFGIIATVIGGWIIWKLTSSTGEL